MLTLTGKAVEGEILKAIEVVPENEIQQHVWDKYKKDVRYQWYEASCACLHLFLYLFTICNICDMSNYCTGSMHQKRGISHTLNQ